MSPATSSRATSRSAAVCRTRSRTISVEGGTTCPTTATSPCSSPVVRPPSVPLLLPRCLPFLASARNKRQGQTFLPSLPTQPQMVSRPLSPSTLARRAPPRPTAQTRTGTGSATGRSPPRSARSRPPPRLDPSRSCTRSRARTRCPIRDRAQSSMGSITSLSRGRLEDAVGGECAFVFRAIVSCFVSGLLTFGLGATGERRIEHSSVSHFVFPLLFSSLLSPLRFHPSMLHLMTMSILILPDLIWLLSKRCVWPSSSPSCGPIRP